ncbi:MAG: ABC transporter ATP-binding protein [Candidatus Hadarchaeales archaeon]
MRRKVIEVRNLVKRYGNILALSGVSFDVYRGEIFTMVGPNGAGKTTTVEILECLRNPTSGNVKIFGMDIEGHEEEIKQRIGVLPQEFGTLERLTVEENVRFIAKIYERRVDVSNILQTLGLLEHRKRKFGELSGGMKRRVGIAMALASCPEIIFLDEPTTGLDPQARQELWQTIKNLRKEGMTIFLTTHYMEEVEALADRAALILNGKILITDSVRSLISKYGGGFRVSISEKRGIRILRKVGEKIVQQDGKTTAFFKSREDMLEAFLYLSRHGLKPEMKEPSMNEVFLNLAGGRINEHGELIQ